MSGSAADFSPGDWYTIGPPRTGLDTLTKVGVCCVSSFRLCLVAPRLWRSKRDGCFSPFFFLLFLDSPNTSPRGAASEAISDTTTQAAGDLSRRQRGVFNNGRRAVSSNLEPGL